MQRYNALEALRLTRSRGILPSLTTHRSNTASSRSRSGGGSQELLRPCPSFPSEADSLQSHPPHTVGSDSGSFSEQSSIETDDDDSSFGTYWVVLLEYDSIILWLEMHSVCH